MRITTVPGVHPTLPDPARDHCKGVPDAPIQLLEYGDFADPICAQAYRFMHAIKHELGERLCFAFRHFPLVNHLHAARAAQAAEAAAAQGHFWAMHDTLFDHQSALADADIIRHATRLRLDATRIMHELETGIYRDRVSEDVTLAERAGVDGAPTFFINGTRFEDVLTLDSLRAAVTGAAR